MKAYFRSHLLDLLLCWIMAVGLSFNMFAGFDMSDPLSASVPAVSGVALVLLSLLFLAGFNHRSTLIGIAVGVCAVLAVVLYLRNSDVLSTTASIDENPVLFWLLVPAVTVAVYLLARSKVGLLILLLGGSILTAAFYFLKFPVVLPGFLAFLGAASVQLLYRTYCVSILKADRGSVKFGGYFLQSALLVLVAAGLAGAVYGGVIRPLNPPTQDLKLITRLQSLEILEKLGVSSTTIIPSNELYSQQLNEYTQMTNEQTQESEPEPPPPEPEEELEGEVPIDGEKVSASPIAYLSTAPIWQVLLLALLAAALIASPFVCKALARRRFLRRAMTDSRENAVIRLYLYFLKCLRYAGFRRPSDATLLEYMNASEKELKSFALPDTDFRMLTQCYLRVLYGCGKVTQKERDAYLQFYRAFRKNLRQKMGIGRYLLRWPAI